MSAAAQRLSQLFSDLQDADKYVRVPGVIVFDEHEEEYWINSEGRRVPKGTEGARKVVRRFKKDDLVEIAQVNNAKNKNGNLTDLNIGHTNPTESDETKQPFPVGYALNYQVQYNRDQQKHEIAADWYIRKDEYPKAKTFPRASIELYASDYTINNIAMLRQAQGRPIPAWHYCRDDDGREVLRYSKGNSSMTMPPMPPENEVHADDVGGHDDMPMQEKLSQYMKHCAKSPHHGAVMDYMKSYGKDDEMEDVDNEGADVGEEVNVMDEGEGEGAEQFSAFGLPSATNTLPNKGKAVKPAKGKTGEMPKKFSKQEVEAQNFNKNMENIRFSKLEQSLKTTQQEIAALKKERDDYKKERDSAECRALVTQLVSEGFDIKDPAKEVLRFSKMDAEGRAEHERFIRDNVPQTAAPPIGPAEHYSKNGRVQTLPGNDDKFVDIEADPESMDPRDVNAVLQYQKTHGLFDLPIGPELIKRALPPDRQQKYIRNGSK